MNKLKLMDYKGEITETPIDLDNLDEIFMIKISVISGDEIAEVIYKNGDIEYYDSSKDRISDFHDGEYVLYGPKENIIEEFKKRNNTYWR